MRTRLAAGLLLLAMLLLAQPAPAQRAPLAEPRFDLVSDGGVISDSVVSALGVDRQGFVWIGTAIGLVRFDGYEFRRMSTAAGKSGAASGFVRTLLVGRDGALWIGSDSDGLARLDPQHLSWTEYRPGGPEGLQKGTVRALAEDARGQMWIGTVGGGLQRMDMASRRIERLPADSGLPDERVQSLLSTQDGSLWVGTWSGVARRAQGATRFEKLPSLSALSGRIVSLMHQDARGRLWIGSQDGELWLCDADGATARRLPRDDLDRGGVQALVEMGTDEIWIGTSIGIERRASSDGQLIGVLRYHAAKPWGPAGADVRTMVRDASGVLWIGSYGGGLQRHVPNGDAIWVRRGEGHGEGVLGVVDARSLVQVPSGEIWLGSNDRGLAVLDTDLRLLKGIVAGQGGYRGGRAGAMAYRAQDDTVWVAGDAGVNVFAATGRRFLRSLPVGRGRMRVMRVGSDGTVWAGLQDGLYRWSGAGAFERVRLNDGQPLTGDVNALGIASDGRLWVGTWNHGVTRLRFAAGADGRVALAAREDFDEHTGLPQLQDNFVQEVDGAALFSTHRGLLRFDEATQRFVPDPGFATIFGDTPRWVVYGVGNALPEGLWLQTVDEASGLKQAGLALAVGLALTLGACKNETPEAQQQAAEAKAAADQAGDAAANAAAAAGNAVQQGAEAAAASTAEAVGETAAAVENAADNAQAALEEGKAAAAEATADAAQATADKMNAEAAEAKQEAVEEKKD